MTHSGVREGNYNRYIVGLDGLRALAVLGVLTYHLLPSILPGGYIGVDIFFVISGFLITTLFISEYARTGKINFKKFWTRRARRLLPALFATIAVACAAALFVRGDILVGLGRQIVGAVTFSNNWVEVAAGANYFDADTTHLFTNFWSLAVEEQFYLAWPFVVAGLLGITWIRQRLRLGILVCGILAIASAVAMVFIFNGINATRVYYGTDTHLFGLMIGAALAFWARSRVSDTALRRLYQPFWSLGNKLVQILGAISCIGIVVLMVTMRDTMSFAYYGGLVLASILAAAIVVATVNAHGVLQKLFTWQLLEWIGVRSYGIYLWHWPILVLLRHALPTTTSWWIIPGLTFILTVVIASFSYQYLEVPVQKQGFRVFLSRGIKRRVLPHPALVGSLVLVIMAVSAVVSAPSKTQAQLRVEAGQNAIKNKPYPVAIQAPTQVIHKPAHPKAEAHGANQAPITGSMITVIGDSVTIASAPALQARFPGILIDAEISRSLRVGGFEAVDKLALSGGLRDVVVVALATNGYFGTGNLDKLVAQLGNRKIIFVTAHVTREWTEANNVDVHALVKNYPNVTVAEWNDMITNHPEDLGDDNIHPNAQGGEIYASSIAVALEKPE